MSLLAAATEIVAAIGAGDDLIGVSHECDHPADVVAGRPVLTKPRVGPLPSSAEVDRSVRQLVSDALSVYDVDTDLLAELSPHVILTQDLCRVCAVSVDDVRHAVAKLAHDTGVALVSLHPRSLADILADVGRVAAATRRPAAGDDVVARLRNRVNQIQRTCAEPRYRPRVVTIEWIDPVMLGGLWMPELVELAGGECVGVTAGEPAPTVGHDLLGRLSPDVVVVKPCGFTVERTLAELSTLAENLPWTEWTRPGNGTRVYVADGNAYFNRSGPRVVDSLELLATLVHPGRFPEQVVEPAEAVRIGPDLDIGPAV